MQLGQIISGVGHVGLIGWMLFGGNFLSEPLPFEVTDVAVISTEDFEAMLAAQGAPETATEVAMPEAPAPDSPAAPDVSQSEDTPPEQSEPEVAETPEPDITPEPVTRAPEPAEVQDRPPEITPPPSEDVAVLVPQESARPKARPAERVAPKPVAKPPEPDAQVDPVVRQEADQSQTSETPQPDEKATAPQEAVSEIVPEAKDEVSSAPKTSKRPQTRPQRAAPAPKPETETASSSTASAVNSALAEAMAGGESEASQSGTTGQSGADPLTKGEENGLIDAISECWTVDLGAASGKVTVVVSVALNRDGTLAASPKFVSARGGDQRAIDVAFRNARTAVISCGRGGFDLPEEKYENWREIEITFNPEEMRLR